MSCASQVTIAKAMCPLVWTWHLVNVFILGHELIPLTHNTDSLALEPIGELGNRGKRNGCGG